MKGTPASSAISATIFKFKHFSKKILPETSPLPEDRGFWRVAILCCETSCTSEIVAHRQTVSNTSRSLLGAANATLTRLCRFQYEPASVPFPIRIDFIEWSGGRNLSSEMVAGVID